MQWLNSAVAAAVSLSGTRNGVIPAPKFPSPPQFKYLAATTFLHSGIAEIPKSSRPEP